MLDTSVPLLSTSKVARLPSPADAGTVTGKLCGDCLGPQGRWWPSRASATGSWDPDNNSGAKLSRIVV